MNHEAQKDSSKPALEKKIYTAPSLVEYGNIAKLTKAIGSQPGDAGSLQPAMCL